MIFSSIVFAIALWSIISASWFFLIPFYLLKAFGLERQAFRYIGRLGRIWGRMIIFVSGSKIHVEGLENIPVGKPYCYIANHQAYTDILLMMAVVPEAAGYIAKKSLSQIPFLRNWMIGMGCYFLKRNSLKDGLKGILFGADRVKKGYPMVIFPEGTRSRGPNMREFRKGGVKLATKAKAWAVPVSIQGTYNVLELHGRVKPSWVAVKFHPPIDTSALKSDEEETLAETLYATIKQGVAELQAQTPRFLR